MSSINQKSYQKCKEAGKFDPQQEKKSIDRNKPIKDKADGISQKEIEIDLPPATLCTMKYPSLYRKHKYDEEENERYKKAQLAHLEKK